MSNFAVLCTKAVRADGYRCVAHFTACMTVPASRRSKWSCTFVLHCRCDHLITHCTLNFAAFIVATQKVWLGHDRPHWFLHLWCGCLAGTCTCAVPYEPHWGPYQVHVHISRIIYSCLSENTQGSYDITIVHVTKPLIHMYVYCTCMCILWEILLVWCSWVVLCTWTIWMVASLNLQ